MGVRETVDVLDALRRAVASRMTAHGLRAGGEAFGAGFELPLHDGLTQVRDGLPEWWDANGNVFLAGKDAVAPAFQLHVGLPPPSRAVVVAGEGVDVPAVMLWGEAPLIVIGAGVRLPSALLTCGGASTIVIGDRTSGNWQARVDSRNGGLVHAGSDGLWGPNVKLYTDDMHAIRSLHDGSRVNAYGGTVIVGRHVWLAEDAFLLSGAAIGDDSVVAARSVVTGAVPANAVCAGSPARTVRTGVTWSFHDLP
jgi:acetyltransferase-like isoleucine patch superfamily enzyme